MPAHQGKLRFPSEFYQKLLFSVSVVKHAVLWPCLCLTTNKYDHVHKCDTGGDPTICFLTVMIGNFFGNTFGMTLDLCRGPFCGIKLTRLPSKIIDTCGYCLNMGTPKTRVGWVQFYSVFHTSSRQLIIYM